MAAAAALLGALVGGFFPFLGVYMEIRSQRISATDNYFRTKSEGAYEKFLQADRQLRGAASHLESDLGNPVRSVGTLRRDHNAVTAASVRLGSAYEVMAMLAGPRVVNASDEVMTKSGVVTSLVTNISSQVQSDGRSSAIPSERSALRAAVNAEAGAIGDLVTEMRKNLGVNAIQPE